MDNCFTGLRDRSRQTSEKDVLYIIPAGPARRVHSPGGASYFLFLSRHRDVIASFSCLVLVRPLIIYLCCHFATNKKIAITHLWHAIEPQTICHLIVKDKIAEYCKFSK